MIAYAQTFFFLDVHLDQGTAFDLLEALEHDAFEIIFVTAYDNNAIRAIKVGALDYILKPIDDDEFHVAVQKVLTLENPKGPVKDLGPVADAFFNRREIKKLVFKTVDDVFILDKDAILYCESEGNYSTIHTLEQNKIMVSKNLKSWKKSCPPKRLSGATNRILSIKPTFANTATGAFWNLSITARFLFLSANGRKR